MRTTAIIGIIIASIIAILGGSAAFGRYKYTRPNLKGVRLIVSVTITLVTLITVGVYAIPPASGTVSSSTIPPASGTNSSSHQGSTPIIGSTMIKIGSDFPVSGRDTAAAKPAENGVALAVQEANDSNAIPGYHLVFVPKDDVGPSGVHDPAVGQANVTSLIGDALVAGIVGPFNSNVAKAEMPEANTAPIALISPVNTNQCLTQEGADIGCNGANDLVPTLRPTGKVTYFRIATTDSHQGPVGADFLFKKNLKTVYVIDDAETYGIAIAGSFTKEWQILGGMVLGRSSEPGSTTSYVSLLTQIASKHPDVIYFGGLDSTGGILIRQQMLQVSGLQNTTFAGGDGIQTTSFATSVGLSGGPVYSTVAAVNPDVLDSAKAFITKYRATYPLYGAYAAGGYDCARIIIQAIKSAIDNGVNTPIESNDAAQAKVFRQAVIDAIQNISFDGVTGHHSFDKNGDTTDKIIAIYQLADVNGQPDWKFVDQLASQ